MKYLFLWDLANRSFTLVYNEEGTVENVLLVMKAIGKFHAISLAIKDQETEIFYEIVGELHEHFFRHGRNPNFNTLFNNAAMNVINSITDDKDVHLLKAISKLYEQNQFDIMVNCFDGKEAEPHPVVIHGDLWAKKTLFRCYDQHFLQKACFIDWKLSRYCITCIGNSELYFLYDSKGALWS